MSIKLKKPKIESSRPRSALGYTPTADDVRFARGNLTQSQAAELVYTVQRHFTDWETGKRRMHASMFHLLCIRTNNEKYFKKVSKKKI